MKKNDIDSTIALTIQQYEEIVKLPIKFFKSTDPSDTHTESKNRGPFLCDFCQLIQRDSAGLNNCLQQRSMSCQYSSANNSYDLFICHAGLREWTVPVYSDNKLYGYFVSGGAVSKDGESDSIAAQKESFLETYCIKSSDFDTAIGSLEAVDNEDFNVFAQLLLDLVKLNGLWKQYHNNRKRSIEPQNDRVEFLIDDVPANSTISNTLPLSFYIDSDNLSYDALNVFFKTLEIQSSEVFKNIMLKRMLEGNIAFDRLMQLAYNESSIEKVKISAEMLFHIISLKYYSKDYWDIRFYKLTFDTNEHLFGAKTKDEIRQCMSHSYKSMYRIYNNEFESLSERSSVSRQVIEFLEANYNRNITVKEAAQHLYMSPSYLSRVFHDEAGFTIKQALTTIRMKVAQDLLLNSDMLIKDISTEVGYKKDVRGFYKMFANYFGMTCSEMRKKYKFNPSSEKQPYPEDQGNIGSELDNE